jgi:predicted SAM-dependent methyltransferase
LEQVGKGDARSRESYNGPRPKPERKLRVSAKSKAKSVGRRLARPFTKRVYGRIDFRADQLHEEVAALPGVIDQRTAALQADIESLNRYLPTVVNTIASQSAAARETERQLRALATRIESVEVGAEAHGHSIVDIFDRIEFVRREILLEQRYAAPLVTQTETDASTRPTNVPVRAYVTNEQKVRSMRDSVRLNVGAGHVLRDGYLNVDFRELPGIDIVADVRELPFDDEEVKEIYSAHLLEHFPVEELRRVVLPRWVSLLADGGRLVSVVPDIETMVSERAAGRMSFEEFIEVMYGGQEYEGDFHFSGFSKEALTRLLEEAGLEDVKVIEEGRRNGVCYEMEIEAVRRITSPE